MTQQKSKIILFLSVGLICVACTTKEVETQYVVVGKESPAPEGVLRYCWEEPVVAYEKINPGKSDDGTWYRPSHVTEKQVKGGRWRPCREPVSEVLEEK